MTSTTNNSRRRCRICKKYEGRGHKMSCDYQRYPSQYPNGPQWETIPEARVTKRGVCPKCSPRTFQLTSKGLIGWHYGMTAAGYSTGARCDGVGSEPFVPQGA